MTIDTVTMPKPLVDSVTNRLVQRLIRESETASWRTPHRSNRQIQARLQQLLSYAATHSDFYRQRLAAFKIAELDLQSFRQIPLLTRDELRNRREAIDCAVTPQEHGSLMDMTTSGSTGSPVSLKASAYVAAIWWANTLRDHVWHQRDASLKAGALRWRVQNEGMAPEGINLPNWGEPFTQFFRTGPACFANSASPISAQLEWLEKQQPDYLVTHPSNLQALLDELATRRAQRVSLKQVRTVGEVVDDSLRASCLEILGAKLVDFYSTEELGYVALQCPRHDHYHVLSDSVFVEILRDDGSPCETGEVGKLVITSLHNYATPLIRYEIGDMAEIRAPCGCGRTLPVLRRINGCVRNMLRMLDGSSKWPNPGFRAIMAVAPLQQFQLVQTDAEALELKLVVQESLLADLEQEIVAILHRFLDYLFQIKFTYSIPFPAVPAASMRISCACLTFDMSPG